ncbi:phenylalanine--tRNA ligase subunit beta [Longibacter salinarum]|uniref:Phenylalanine--tRNA ligase beta subunit n=1 Tax=Longibacter salinarum TaxID=1850348 RepID=A0A2A8CU12_9BACT|nr:phenylalanine--tRNA ligase subunit beta [Longibacter salinarum]PEN11279.1 phenylalanine--tRNA ligase subunit beta [Longibacter salinarum]
MDISYRWLERYVHLEESPEALAEQLTMAGLEVDDVSPIGSDLEGVVVGEVMDVRDHPNADRLVLCDVDIGKDKPSQIACGAPNVAAGQKVPVATVGTTLYLPDRENPEERQAITIEKRSIRGESSRGMICAEDELGLSEDHGGIMVLDPDAEIGRPFAEYLADLDVQPEDAVIDIDLTPNRPDAASHIGVARDVAAINGRQLCRPEVNIPTAGGDAADQVSVDIQDPAGCERYVAMVVRDVEVKESPLWLKRRLSAIGLRPRNNVVDITNFVLHEVGQPLHAFDLNTIADNRIVVRSSEGEETFTTLDDKERTLPDGTLLICDAEEPVAVAGVMGGAESEVSDETTDVLIESAYFDPSTIRKTAKALSLQTDSSYRFERGVDRDGQLWAAARAAELIAELAGGTIVPGCVDAHPTPSETRTATLRLDRLTSVLGVNISREDAINHLESVGFVVSDDGGTLNCEIPTWRPDVSIEEDLIEEVARLYGYNAIPEPARVPIPNVTPGQRPVETLRRQVRTLLKGRGFREIYTNSMLRTERAEQFAITPGRDAPVSVVETQNPISQEMAALRPRLLPGALQVMQYNRNHGQKALRLFETGHVFRRAEGDEEPIVEGFSEHEALLLAMTGPHSPGGWDTDVRPSDYFDLKGIVEMLLDDLHLNDVSMTPHDGEASNNHVEPTIHRLDVHAGDRFLGTLSQVNPSVTEDVDLEDAVFVAELNLEALVDAAAPNARTDYEPVSRFPVVERDLAVLVADAQSVGPMLDTIRTAGQPLLKDIDVFDVYRGEGVGRDEKSVAFTLRFGADRTLTDAEVDTKIDAAVKELARSFGAELRE